ncbi:alpha-amylase family glycosyl hydrolase [uncultured Polaribacter sp.]|uniref:alpha-amylase family glycosyl hydrolase n=1 Tax=uncultured Polaribacter sp. TaxID=174711 RepID=UPI0030DCAB2D|tara:strand:+ start:17180 stop:18571 length:1392 start_codon:yes stop_codon:yes gene_type:complete
MRKFLSVFLTLFFTTFFLSCQNTDDQISEIPDVITGYTQYGKIFTNVPDPQDAVIYQVNLRAFSPEGTLKGAQKRLDSIKSLGANVIYLMPVFPNGQVRSAGGLGSPYAVADYKKVSTEFGTLDHLKDFVEEAHKRDLTVILDWVANHTAWDNPWITAHKDWYQQDANGNIIIPPNTNYQDVAQLNYNNQELRSAMIDAMSYWVYNANIDGFRCDYADFVPQDFWKKANETIRSIKNQQMLLFAEGSNNKSFSVGFDYIFGFGFFEALKDVVGNNHSATAIQDKNSTEYLNVSDNSKRVVRYTSNHDINSFDGTPFQLFGGKKGSMATFVVAAYMKSVPMIYNGQEVGYNTNINFFNKEPINWGVADYQLLKEYKKIIKFRNESNAIRRGRLTGFSSNDVSAFTMEINQEKVLVISNLRNKTIKYTSSSALTSIVWKDAFSNASVQLETALTLEPFQYLILKN